MIDDTAIPKKGKHSVGVAAQYASALGSRQLPDAGISDVGAWRGAGDGGSAPLPSRKLDERSGPFEAGWRSAEHWAERTKPEIALAEIDRMIAARVHFGCVLADAGYGLSAPFRQGLTARGLAWAVGIPRHLKVYPVDVQLIWPIAKRGRPRQRSIPDILSIPAEDMLADAKWQNITWRTGTKGKLKACFAAVRVRIADGPPQRIRDKGQQHLPGDEAWLVGEHRASGEKKYYLANLPAETNLRTLAATIKARWICEPAHQQMKEELRARSLRGSSWHGLHRHALQEIHGLAEVVDRFVMDFERDHRAAPTDRRCGRRIFGAPMTEL